uniref:Putative secreted protein n=1 Tax=Ixodes ricinus TaxID=34613 RepID=A0A6B0UVV0_IXORI
MTSPLLVSHILFVRFGTVHSSLIALTSRPWQCVIERRTANYEPRRKCGKGRSRELASLRSAVTAVQQRRASQLCSASPHNEPQTTLRANKANPTPRRCRATFERHAQRAGHLLTRHNRGAGLSGMARRICPGPLQVKTEYRSPLLAAFANSKNRA